MIKLIDNPKSDEELFGLLHPAIREWFKRKFSSFCLTQKYGVWPIYQRQNVLISAVTGSGKTLTAFLSILNELIDSSEKGILEDKVYCLYVSPLKSLSNDILFNLINPLKEIEEIAGKSFGLRIKIRTGDTKTKEKSEMLKEPPHILITTPETLAIVLCSFKFKEHLKKVDWVIVDEIHSLAENKRGVHLSLSLEWLQRLNPGITRIGLSATISPLEEVAKFLVGYQNDQPRDCLIADIPLAKDKDFQVLSPVKSLIDIDYALKQTSFYHLIHQLIQQHKTTLIFTNTRSATERVIDHLKEMFPSFYNDNNLAAHHSSLSASLREESEENLRKGELKACVSSTSLELGIDIGSIDLVLCLGSPKSIARFVQRAGRSGHALEQTIKSKMIVMDSDDLVECSLILKSALENKIDKIHLPKNSLDVLAQQTVNFALGEKITAKELFDLIRKSYSFHQLSWPDFEKTLNYLAGHFVSLEERNVFAKIWYDKETGIIGRRGKLTRMIFMTNVGTIPEESYILVKEGEKIVGKIDEAFLERLRPNDTFVLGGKIYQFKYTRGMVAYVSSSVNRPPTIPSWFSEMLPLSFDLALEISRLRRLIKEKLEHHKSKEEIIDFICRYLYLQRNEGKEIYNYFYHQFNFGFIPDDREIVIEYFKNKELNYAVFHTLFGRRVNDCLSRAIGYAVAKLQHLNVDLGLTDQGFYLSSSKSFNALKALRALKPEHLKEILEKAIERSEILNRRFRHCACRALMILRQYKGKRKMVGRQQISSRILMSAVKRINYDFPILKEARREILEDLMDYQHTFEVLKKIENKEIKVKEIHLSHPSPFSLKMLLEGYEDLIKIEDKHQFLRRMYQIYQEKK